jgi:serine/threonine-protein kinase
VSRFPLKIPPEQQLINARGPDIALSPDGSMLVYLGESESGIQLLLRKMGQLDASPIPGTEGAYSPFFSSDSQWVGFFSGGVLKKVLLSGAPPLSIAKVINPYGGTWGENGIIIYGTRSSGLFQVSDKGGTPERLTTPDKEQGVTSHRWPDILPGNKAVLVTIWRTDLEDASIGIVDLKTGEVRELMEMAIYPRYSLSGHLIFGNLEGSLLAARFDLSRLKLKGSVISLLDGTQVTRGGDLNFTLSRNGSLVYALGISSYYSLVMVNRQGLGKPLGLEGRRFRTPKFSPDGDKAALSITDGRATDIWIYSFEHGLLTRLTLGEYDWYPTWTMDGERIIFASTRSGIADIYFKKADGSSDAELFFKSETNKWEPCLSPDGKTLVYRKGYVARGPDIFMLPLEEERKAQPYLNTSSSELNPMVHPKGRWLLFTSDESGQREVYIRTFPDPSEGRWQVSVNGGQEPLWSRDGKELFYRSHGDNKIVSVEVKTEPVFELGTRKILFDDVYVRRTDHPNYDIHPDNDRFLMIKRNELESTEIIIVLNWFEELKRIVPSGK